MPTEHAAGRRLQIEVDLTGVDLTPGVTDEDLVIHLDFDDALRDPGPVGVLTREQIAAPPMSVRDVALLDLARFLLRQTLVPLRYMEGETFGLFHELRKHADGLSPGTPDAVVLQSCEAVAPPLVAAALARHTERRDAG